MAEFYLNNTNLKAKNVTISYTQEQINEYIQCKNDPIYFIKKHCKIVSLDHGLINFELYDYQVRFIDAMHNNNRVISMQPRQMGKTQTVAAYILHYVLFNENKNVAILANKAAAAREIMSRFQLMYEYLPSYLQQGITTWNKGDVELENGSKIFTAATSASGIRGKSCVTGDTKVCILEADNIYYTEIDNIINNSIFSEVCGMKYTVYKTTNLVNNKIYIGFHVISENHITRLDFGALSCYSDGYLGSGKLIKTAIEKYGPENFAQEILGVFDTKEEAESLERELVDETFVSEESNQQIQDSRKILSSSGFRDFDGFINQGMPDSLYLIKFESGNEIKVTGDHKFLTQTKEWISAEDLNVFDELFGDIVYSVTLIDNQVVYDALNVKGVHNYYTNGVISHNCNLLYVDEAAIIPNTVADEFFTSTYPTISAGKTTKIVLTSTPLGYNHWWKFWNESIEGRNGFVPIEIKYNEHPDRDEEWAKKQRELLGELKYKQEVICSFLGSALTLISSDTIAHMSYVLPIYSNEGLDIYENPVLAQKDANGKIASVGGNYIIVVDTAKGVGGDASSFQVIDITTVPYKIVAKYKNNEISPMLYPSVIHKVARDYNNAYVLIEINVSEQVAHILYSELEYDNMIFVTRTPKGQVASAGFAGAGKTALGLTTDKRIKRIGCFNFKSLVEEKKLLIHDADTIAEISTFIEQKGSYAADDGYHDDLVMPLVMFGWLTTNPYFKELTNVNLRTEIYQQRIAKIEEEMTPFGFVDDGFIDDVYVEDGDAWRVFDKPGYLSSNL